MRVSGANSGAVWFRHIAWQLFQLAGATTNLSSVNQLPRNLPQLREASPETDLSQTLAAQRQEAMISTRTDIGYVCQHQQEVSPPFDAARPNGSTLGRSGMRPADRTEPGRPQKGGRRRCRMGTQVCQPRHDQVYGARKGHGLGYAGPRVICGSIGVKRDLGWLQQLRQGYALSPAADQRLLRILAAAMPHGP